jgi:hypothetical protein
MGRSSLVDPQVLGVLLEAGPKGATVADVVRSLPSLTAPGVVRSMQRLLGRDRILRREEVGPEMSVTSKQDVQIQVHPRRFRYWHRAYRAYIPSSRGLPSDL